MEKLERRGSSSRTTRRRPKHTSPDPKYRDRKHYIYNSDSDEAHKPSQRNRSRQQSISSGRAHVDLRDERQTPDESGSTTILSPITGEEQNEDAADSQPYIWATKLNRIKAETAKDEPKSLAADK